MHNDLSSAEFLASPVDIGPQRTAWPTAFHLSRKIYTRPTRACSCQGRFFLL